MDLWGTLEWVGRILFAVFFVMSGLTHLVRGKTMTGYVQSKGVPAPALALAVTGVMLLAGGLSILLRWHSTVGAGLLVAFLVPTAFIMHNFWVESDPMMKANQKAHFWKNLTLSGAAILYAVAHHRGAL
jgi:putative oxidoreductase